MAIAIGQQLRIGLQDTDIGGRHAKPIRDNLRIAGFMALAIALRPNGSGGVAGCIQGN